MIGYRKQPTHSGEVLREEFLKPLGISRTALARELGVSFRTINGIVNERREVSPEMALKLAKHFGTTPKLWLNLQMKYNLWKAARKMERATAFGGITVFPYKPGGWN